MKTEAEDNKTNIEKITIPELRIFPTEEPDKGYHLWNLDLSNFRIVDGVFDYQSVRKEYDRLKRIIKKGKVVYTARIPKYRARNGKRAKVNWEDMSGASDYLYIGSKSKCDKLVSLIRQSQTDYQSRLTEKSKD